MKPFGEVLVLSQFAVQYEHRASVKLERIDVINAFVDIIPTVRPLTPFVSMAFKIAVYPVPRCIVAWALTQNVTPGVA